MRHADSSWWVYICSKSDKLYVGITTDLKHRMKQHAGSELLYREGPFTESEAAGRERQLKGWNRGKKLRLIQNKPGMSMRACPELAEGSHVRGANIQSADFSGSCLTQDPVG